MPRPTEPLRASRGPLARATQTDRGRTSAARTYGERAGVSLSKPGRPRSVNRERDPREEDELAEEQSEDEGSEDDEVERDDDPDGGVEEAEGASLATPRRLAYVAQEGVDHPPECDDRDEKE